MFCRIPQAKQSSVMTQLLQYIWPVQTFHAFPHGRCDVVEKPSVVLLLLANVVSLEPQTVSSSKSTKHAAWSTFRETCSNFCLMSCSSCSRTRSNVGNVLTHVKYICAARSCFSSAVDMGTYTKKESKISRSQDGYRGFIWFVNQTKTFIIHDIYVSLPSKCV